MKFLTSLTEHQDTPPISAGAQEIIREAFDGVAPEDPISELIQLAAAYAFEEGGDGIDAVLGALEGEMRLLADGHKIPGRLRPVLEEAIHNSIEQAYLAQGISKGDSPFDATRALKVLNAELLSLSSNGTIWGVIRKMLTGDSQLGRVVTRNNHASARQADVEKWALSGPAMTLYQQFFMRVVKEGVEDAFKKYVAEYSDRYMERQASRETPRGAMIVENHDSEIEINFDLLALLIDDLIRGVELGAFVERLPDFIGRIIKKTRAAVEAANFVSNDPNDITSMNIGQLRAAVVSLWAKIVELRQQLDEQKRLHAQAERKRALDRLISQSTSTVPPNGRPIALNYDTRFNIDVRENPNGGNKKAVVINCTAPLAQGEILEPVIIHIRPYMIPVDEGQLRRYVANQFLPRLSAKGYPITEDSPFFAALVAELQACPRQ